MSESEFHHALGCGRRGAGAGAGRREPFAFPGTTRKYSRDRVVDVLHTRLEIEVDPARRRVAGVARHTVAAMNDGCDRVVFDALELSIGKVTDGKGRELASGHVDGELTVHLKEPLAAGAEATISIAYHGSPRRGLWFIGPDEGYPDKPVQAWTQGQDEDARCWFPCFDHPVEKATTEIVVTAPSRYATLSNGALVGKTAGPGKDATTWHWRLGTPHATYLVTLVVGEFDEVTLPGDGVPLTALVPKGRAKDGLRCLGRTGEMMRVFNARFGVDYPYEKYAQAVVADFIFGGMENTSATTLTEFALYDERAGLDHDADDLVAHELAHQWWGDLLTCRDWSHAWLNEGFATWSEEIFREHHLGADEATMHVLQAAKRYLAEDGGEYRRPIVCKEYDEPIDVFDRHLYEKGGWVLRMLRAELGEEPFWRSIRHYARTNRGRTVVTDDLRRAIEEATGRNVEAFLDQWIFGAGHPEMKASWCWDEKTRSLTVRIEQTQKAEEGTASAFRGTLRVEIVHGKQTVRRDLALTERVHAFHIACSERPDVVRFDPEARWLAAWTLDVGVDAHRKALASDPWVACRMRAAAALGKDGGAETVQALARAVTEDGFWGVSAEAAAALAEIRTPAAREALLHALATVKHPKARRAVVSALGAFRGDETAAEALAEVLAKGDASLFVEAEAAEALGKTRAPEAREAIEKALARKSSWAETIRAGCVRGLGRLGTEDVVPTLLERLAWGQHVRVRSAAAGALAEVGARLVVRDRIREALEQRIDDRDFRVQMAAIAALRALGDERALPALRRAAAQATDGRVRRGCRAACRRLEQRAERAPELAKLADGVEALRGEVAKLLDRVQRLEGGPAPKRVSPAGKRAAAARKRGPRRGR
ncbi:MAG TPA: M1 family aminopeptidase [Planctomycetota bacterium]|nr:M1 family aminopeptidase [Planctomycetota bacterium]